MIDATNYNASIRDDQRMQVDNNENNIVEEAATQFAELFLAQCMYERKSQKRKTTDSETIC